MAFLNLNPGAYTNFSNKKAAQFYSPILLPAFNGSSCTYIRKLKKWWVMAENTIWPFNEVTHDNAGAGPFQSKQALKLLLFHQDNSFLA